MEDEGTQHYQNRGRGGGGFLILKNWGQMRGGRLIEEKAY